MPQQQTTNRKAPRPATTEEIKELAANRELIEMWSETGTTEDMEMILEESYIAKFDFVNAFPGYCGELFIIQPDYLADDAPAVRVIRDKSGRLVVVTERTWV